MYKTASAGKAFVRLNCDDQYDHCGCSNAYTVNDSNRWAANVTLCNDFFADGNDNPSAGQILKGGLRREGRVDRLAYQVSELIHEVILCWTLLFALMPTDLGSSLIGGGKHSMKSWRCD